MRTWNLMIEFEAAMHHGSGLGLAGLLDRPLLRDERGLPYLSGAALKGKLRHAALQLCRSGFGGACSQVAGSFCRGEPRCRMCRLFGSPWTEGALRFTDARPRADDLALLGILISAGDHRELRAGTEVRRTTAIDRRRRGTRRYHLFSTETAAKLEMEARISGSLTDPEVEFLRACCQVLTHFGAGSTRGLGRCQYRLEEVVKA